jgi:hypothetical protein
MGCFPQSSLCILWFISHFSKKHLAKLFRSIRNLLVRRRAWQRE